MARLRRLIQGRSVCNSERSAGVKRARAWRIENSCGQGPRHENALEQIPLSVAVTIAGDSDAAVQRALAEAYEKKELRGKALLRARRLVEERRSRGKAFHRGVRSRANGNVSSDQILKTYREENQPPEGRRAEGEVLREPSSCSPCRP